MLPMWDDFPLTPQQEELFGNLYDCVIAGNERLNLTRITTRENFWEKHLWDSLWGIAPYFTVHALNVIDIGSGAGFPGLPIAIAKPHWQITLVESRQKKAAFLTETIDRLGLKNVRAVADRAEHLNQQRPFRHAYDLATVRAVADLKTCLHYALPFLAPQGLAVLYRGQWSEQEETDLAALIQNRQCVLMRATATKTPLSGGIRHCLYLSNSVSTSGSKTTEKLDGS
ncbi:MAG: 16S rRNA (guanine(527)-N(7))-methyltransferase RsmG [Oscillatoriales cyanobacterium SM2_2_1]|nr:16S rRNA (guanine(527)-N(7))-methyltransferase RsmG [Oscillatoriales cyanobacterium SM2_2_1]